MRKICVSLCLLAAICWYALGLSSALEVAAQKHRPVFRVRLSSTIVSTAQFFFDVGHGFRQEDSALQALRAGPEVRTYDFRPPIGLITALRFDPFMSPGAMRIEAAWCEDAAGRTLAEFPLASFVASNQISLLQREPSDLLVLTAAAGFDPQMLIELPAPIDLRGSERLDAWQRAGPILWHTVLTLLVGLVLWDSQRALGWSRLWQAFAPVAGESARPFPILIYLTAALAALVMGGAFIEQTLLQFLL